MKITIYKCDNCGKLLSDPSQDIGLRHISCSFDTYSGWVERKLEKITNIKKSNHF